MCDGIDMFIYTNRLTNEWCVVCCIFTYEPKDVFFCFCLVPECVMCLLLFTYYY